MASHSHNHNKTVENHAGKRHTTHVARAKRVLYFDCIGGISGDMILGALVDLGCPLQYIRDELNRLRLDDHYEITARPKFVHKIKGTSVKVRLTKPDTHSRRLAEILEIIGSAGLKPTVAASAGRVFHALGEAEADVHGVGIDDIHFHEVGAVDSIVDIVGSCIAIDYFSPDAVYCTPMRTGTGFVKAMHGVLPVPVPAVVRLAKGRTLEYLDHDGETTTPTGAAILLALAEERPTLKLKVENTGYGCGEREIEEFPNLLRVILGAVG